MVRSDFKAFLKDFYQVQNYFRYAQLVFVDELFGLAEYDAKNIIHKEFMASRLMGSPLHTRMKSLFDLLSEYNHLLLHDQNNCQTNSSLTCWFRKYGLTIFSLLLMAVISYIYLRGKSVSIASGRKEV